MSFWSTKYRAWKGTSPNSRKIFIIGCGRSGTHWLGHILKAHPDICVTIEAPYTFKLVTEMALNMHKIDKLFPRLVRRYRLLHALVAPKYYADKSHPNIWLAEKLAETFQDAVFLGIQRNPYATVASMLKHPGVLAWHNQWKKFPIPNPFLGIDEKTVQDYDDMPLAAKCALRWRAHAERMEYLRSLLGSRLLVIRYEDLILNTEKQLWRLSEFLQLKSPLPMPKVKVEALDRWRSELSPQTLKIIAQVVGKPWSNEIDSVIAEKGGA